MKFSHKETKDLFFAGVMISFAFAILLSGGLANIFSLNLSFAAVFLFAFFTAGAAFVIHELMHKYVAQRYGFYSEFRAFYPMLWLAILFSFFGFIIAAPGAVFIHGFGKFISKEKNGKISLAGPLSNIVLALIFLLVYLFFDFEGLIKRFFHYGLTINSLLAAFNMIPVMPFDGAKIISWSKVVYFTVLFFALILYILSWFI